MDLEVYWTDFAIERLEGIFDFYISRVSSLKAQKIVDSITDTTILLEKHPKIGQVEEQFKSRNREYRYLVSRNYKIIYWINVPYVYIATVFDCRQDPTLLKDILK